MDLMVEVQIKTTCPQDPPHCSRQHLAGPCLLDLPGHHQKLVNLLIHKWIVGFPHLGLQFCLITAILLTYREHVRFRRTAKAVGIVR